MNTFKGHVNYGCLAAEKRPVFTAGLPHATATASDPVEYTVPEGWELGENAAGQTLVTAPWGWTYDPNELLAGKEHPCFIAVDKEGNEHRVELKWKEL